MILYRSALLLLLVALLSCEKSESNLTTIEGVLTNPYTKQPIKAAKLVVYHETSGGLFGGGFSSDSVTSATSDDQGRYALSFTKNAAGKYPIRLAGQQELYDVQWGFDGNYNTQIGQKNTLDFQVTPFKEVTININSTKGGSTDISFDIYSSSPAPWFHVTIFSDSVKANQVVKLTKKVRIPPGILYDFTKSTYTRYRIPNQYGYDFKQNTTTTIPRRVEYTDTTTVNFN